MQTILGANGQIGRELAAHLMRASPGELRLVSRRPEKVNVTDLLFAADLLDPRQAREAVQGSTVVYLTVGLPMDTALWTARWPVITRNVLDACAEHGAKLVFFDNTYMYPQTSEPQTEATPFRPAGAKGRVRAEIATMLLDATARGRVQGLICRAPEFYGPGRTQSITNTMILENLRAGRSAKVLLRDDTRRSLVFTPDASRAMALLGKAARRALREGAAAAPLVRGGRRAPRQRSNPRSAFATAKAVAALPAPRRRISLVGARVGDEES